MIRKLLTPLLLIAWCAGIGAAESRHDDNSNNPGLHVTFHVDKPVYHLSDSMLLQILVKNVSHRDLYIFDSVGLDEANTLDLSIKNVATGKRYDVWLSSDPAPPPPKSKDGFKLLLPNEICGIEVSQTLSGFFIDKPGQYELTALYESPIPSAAELSYHLPIWGKEKGLLHSDPIVILVEE